jgi:hypothetical protein
VFAVLAGKLKPALRNDCEAGHTIGWSTRRSAMARSVIRSTCHATRSALLVDLSLESGKRAPSQIALDLDATDIPLLGRQAASSAAIAAITASCRCTCFAAAMCCSPGYAVRTSMAAPARSRRSPGSPGSCRASVEGGRIGIILRADSGLAREALMVRDQPRRLPVLAGHVIIAWTLAVGSPGPAS